LFQPKELYGTERLGRFSSNTTRTGFKVTYFFIFLYFTENTLHVVINNFYFSSEATQKWLGITVKILKVLAYMLTFLVVLGTAANTRHCVSNLSFSIAIRPCCWLFFFWALLLGAD
jgi:hypothetical protein